MWRVEKNIEYVSKTFRLPLALVTRMEEAAQQNGVSLNKFVFQSLNYALDNLAAPVEEPALEENPDYKAAQASSSSALRMA